MNKLVVLADLGGVKAYRVLDDPLGASPKMELIDDFELTDAHEKFSDGLTDQAGRFPIANGSGGGMAIGENHNLGTERQRRLIHEITGCIEKIVHRENAPSWYLAASQEINRRVVEQLAHDVRSKIHKNVEAGLRKLDKSVVLATFEKTLTHAL